MKKKFAGRNRQWSPPEWAVAASDRCAKIGSRSRTRSCTKLSSPSSANTPTCGMTLLATGDSTIVEHTENDAYWGDGGDGSGKNRLGQILMRVREKLPSVPTPGDPAPGDQV